ncbi:MAG: four helix bundle protein [Candidatus Promineifilaceae bacterium]
MARIKQFEDLIAWQKARLLTRKIYDVTRMGDFSKDFGLRNQIQRAAVSTMSNIAEGFERGSSADFHRFLIIAKASCGEVRSQLYIALDVGYLSDNEFRDLMSLAIETGKVIGGLAASIARRKGKQ